MTEHAVVRVADREPAKREEPLGGYDQFVDSIGVNSAQRWQRELAGRRLLRRHPDITAWMVCGQQRRAPASWAAERREEHRPTCGQNLVRNDLTGLSHAVAR